MRCAMDEEEEHTIARFLGALRTEISEVVQLQQYLSYTDVCRLALRVEKQLKGRGKPSTSRLPFSSKHVATQNFKKPATWSDTHSGNTSLGNMSTPSTQRVVRCFKCQGIGHVPKECPNKQLATLIEDSALVYDMVNEDEGVER